MTEELKVRIRDYETVEKNLLAKGAKFVKEISAEDTYFMQPNDLVLKLTQDDRGSFLANLKLKNGKFEIIRYEPIADANKVKNELSKEFGVKCVLRKKRRFLEFYEYSININIIDDLGEFLIVEGENLVPEIITTKLEIQKPEFITVSFDNLKRFKN